ncbi:hypothetical protein DAPPUDRAFT_113139 [Daphnia pulex]|uniref:Uncharacterized protein n=1 Tax=Daphnia pulex TaxID=6669 RepID=E9HE71_DAPPU|nr:hypothetical protein DAPPUDRAFT_113139 [Daphnia pulex]|eukprot:EFX69963.1 hypothetical protein DAPPUDRAFT_113139 [Daphnia pulex]
MGKEEEEIFDCRKCEEVKRKKKMKKVRFADEVEEIVSENLSESAPKRSRGGLGIKLIDSAFIPGDSMMFVAAKVKRKFTGKGAVKLNQCAHPGKEWMVPSTIVNIKKGKLKIPIVNLQSSPLQFKRRDLITTVDIDLEAEIVMDVKEADSPVCCTATVNESKPTPRPSWVDKLRFGENLSEEEKINLLSVIKQRWRCFPSEDGQIGKTDQAEHLIDTGDAKPVRSAPYRVSRYEREIIVDEVAKMLRRPVMAQENKFPWPPERQEPYAVFAKRVADLREAARLRIIEKQQRVKERIDRSRRVTQELRVGELVLVKRNLTKKGKTKKFLPKFVGPYQVVKKVCETTYLVEDIPFLFFVINFFIMHSVILLRIGRKEQADRPSEGHRQVRLSPKPGRTVGLSRACDPGYSN